MRTDRKAPEQPPLFEGAEPKPLPPIEERKAMDEDEGQIEKAGK